MDDIVVYASGIRHLYPDGTEIKISGLEFKIERGQRVAILGPNGAGKSTLIQHILGLEKPVEGRIKVFGKDPARDFGEIMPRLGALMQNTDEQLIGPTVFDDVAFKPLNLGYSKEDTHLKVESILRTLGVYHLRDKLPHYLSGGERKKVAIAGALVTEPELLVLDEPLVGIDYRSRCDITDFLSRLHEETGMTIISTLHDIEMVHEIADYGYVMKHGGNLELYGSIIELFFEHDLSSYNLAPPAIVRLIQNLRCEGLNLTPTFDANELIAELKQFLRPAS